MVFGTSTYWAPTVGNSTESESAKTGLSPPGVAYNGSEDNTIGGMTGGVLALIAKKEMPATTGTSAHASLRIQGCCASVPRKLEAVILGKAFITYIPSLNSVNHLHDRLNVRAWAKTHGSDTVQIGGV